MFSQASVILPIGGMCGEGGMRGEGGVHGNWVCMVKGGMHGEGACMAGGMCGRGACVAGEMATAMDGMHPTGMHSCFMMKSIWNFLMDCIFYFINTFNKNF